MFCSLNKTGGFHLK